MKTSTTTPDADARLADVLDRMARDLDRIACGSCDLGQLERGRLVEMLAPIADELHAVGVAAGPASGGQRP